MVVGECAGEDFFQVGLKIAIVIGPATGIESKAPLDVIGNSISIRIEGIWIDR